MEAIRRYISHIKTIRRYSEKTVTAYEDVLSRYVRCAFKDEVPSDDQIVASLNRSEARRLVQQGGVLVNGEKVTDFSAVFTNADFNEDGTLLIKKGKKSYHQIKEG